MSLLSENVIPGNYGKIFSTNAKEVSDLKRIEKVILSLDGIKDIILNTDVYPAEFTVHTSKIIKIEDIENAVKKIGFHAIPKSLFAL